MEMEMGDGKVSGRGNVMFESWLSSNNNNLYPSKTQKDELVDKSGLTYAQVARWFANRRRKVKLASAGGRSGSSGSLSSSATSPSASDLPTEPWPTDTHTPEKEAELSEGEVWVSSGRSESTREMEPALLGGMDPSFLYAAYIQQLLGPNPFLPLPFFAARSLPSTFPGLPTNLPLTLPLSQPYHPPNNDAALLMEEVLKASAKIGRPSSPTAPLSPSSAYSTTYTTTTTTPLSNPLSINTDSHWDEGLSEEESIAVSVLASFAQQKHAAQA